VILGIPLDGRKGTALIRDTDGGRLDGDPLYDRAVGPMQFIPGTWKSFAADGNGDGIADPHNIYDAAVATGNYLCKTAGGPVTEPENASRAVYAYNRSAEYNRQVLTLADHYRRTLNPNLPPPTTPPTVPPDPTDLPPPASPTEPTTTDSTVPEPTSTTTTSTTIEPAPSTSTSTSSTTTNPPHPALEG
jgi:membrane-bound lytic murein transglycosylase B